MNNAHDPYMELYWQEDDRPAGWPYGIEQHEFERKECTQCQMMKDVHRLVRGVCAVCHERNLTEKDDGSDH